MTILNFKTVEESVTELGINKTIELMKSELGITMKEFDSFLYMCNYDQIESPKTHPLVIQCRSLIVDHSGKVVSKKYDRFFNIGECPEIVGQIDIADSTIFDKEDGSLIGIWKNPFTKKWDISTRSMPKSEGEFERPNGQITTFREMVLETLGVSEDIFQEKMGEIADYYFSGEKLTFVFEWCHPENRIVTRYVKPEMFLVCATSSESSDIESTVQQTALLAEEFSKRFQNVSQIGYFNSHGKTIQEIEFIVANLKDLKEGFVIQCNKTGIRAKIKSKTYVQAHRLRGEFKTPRDKDLCELIQTNETDEFIAYFPEWEGRIRSIENQVESYINCIDACWKDLKDIENMKDFALAVQNTSFGSITSGMLYARKRKGTDFEESKKQLSKNKFHDFYIESCRIG